MPLFPTLSHLGHSKNPAVLLRCTRCEGGEELEALMTPEFSSTSKSQDAGRMSSRSSLLSGSYGDSDADSLAGLYEVRT